MSSSQKINAQQVTRHEQVNKMRSLLDSIHNKIRVVKLRQNEANSKLGFSLRGGKESTGSSVGVFVSHVERNSEADKKGLKIGDQLIQVNGLNVDAATYDQVIGLIRQTPKRHDILLKVNNLGRIPFQEKSGECIKWLQVLDLMEDSMEDVDLPKGFSLSSNNSDEGIESCESQRANSLSGESDEVETSLKRVGVAGKRVAGAQSGNGYQDDSALSSSLTLSNDECCSCSSVSLSLSSVSARSRDATESSGAEEEEESAADTPIRVPGGRTTSEAFGCGVVKGPDEWPGIYVQNVKAGSLAERVGLEAGDQLMRADNRALNKLSFERAIELIKRLQQQQDELLLHVRKGAALKYLADRHQSSGTNVISDTQRQQSEMSNDEDMETQLEVNSDALKQTIGGVTSEAEQNICMVKASGKSPMESNRFQALQRDEKSRVSKTISESNELRVKSYACKREQRANEAQNAKCENSSQSAKSLREKMSVEDEDPQEEIRIVSQNCKLHHSSHNLKSLAQEKFARLALGQTIVGYQSPLRCAQMRRSGQQTDEQVRQKNSVGRRLQRYVSADNLAPTNRQLQMSSTNYTYSRDKLCCPAQSRSIRQRVDWPALQQCCRVQPQQMGADRKFGGTMGAELALCRSERAQSAEKLNMNISLNYVKIGLNQRQSNALRRGNTKQHKLLLSEQICCGSGSCELRAQPRKAALSYHYAATSARLISTDSPTRARPRKPTCCVGVAVASPMSELGSRQSVCCERQLYALSGAQNRVKRQQAAYSCCSLRSCCPNPPLVAPPIYDRSTGYRADRYRLLQLCAVPAPPQPPPPPPLSSGPRDTRQRLSTFRCPQSSALSSVSVSVPSPAVRTPTPNNSAIAKVGRTADEIPRPPPPPKPEADSEVSDKKEVCATLKVTKNSSGLCFVDELKMLAKRQQNIQKQQVPTSAPTLTSTSASSSSPSPIDSSTLIKIINASKSETMRKGCSCQRVDFCAHKSIVETKCSQSESKSVKLNEEDNKRRQHEMLMKEFKSAHSRMFSKRRNTNLDEETNQQQVNSSLVEDPKIQVRTTIKTLATSTKVKNLLLPQQSSMHLAAAN